MHSTDFSFYDQEEFCIPIPPLKNQNIQFSIIQVNVGIVSCMKDQNNFPFYCAKLLLHTL